MKFRKTVVRPAFKGSVWKNGPSPWEILTLKGGFEVTIINDSGIRDPQFGIVRIEIMRTDLSCDIHTHTPARKSYTNFQLYYFVIQICSTNWLGHGHGYKWHSSIMRTDRNSCGKGARRCAPHLRAENLERGNLECRRARAACLTLGFLLCEGSPPVLSLGAASERA